MPWLLRSLAAKGHLCLEEVDIFNLLCLPGVTDSGTLMDAIPTAKSGGLPNNRFAKKH